MPFYDHECQECMHVWEDFYSARRDPPDTCPNCGTVGKVMRLIPNNISVRVTLTGNELKQKVKEDAQKLRKQIQSDEKLASNFDGESTYQEKTKTVEALTGDLKNV